jgi:prefoldin subunit 5
VNDYGDLHDILSDKIRNLRYEVENLRQQLAEMTARAEEAEKALQQIATLEVSINGHNVNAQEYMRDIAIKALEDTK